jgi:hypothetical protein
MPKTQSDYPITLAKFDDVKHVVSNLDIINDWLTDEADRRTFDDVIENVCNSQFQYVCYNKFLETIIEAVDHALAENEVMETIVDHLGSLMESGAFLIVVDTGDSLG